MFSKTKNQELYKKKNIYPDWTLEQTILTIQDFKISNLPFLAKFDQP